MDTFTSDCTTLEFTKEFTQENCNDVSACTRKAFYRAKYLYISIIDDFVYLGSIIEQCSYKENSKGQ